MSENYQNIRQFPELYHENHGKLKSGISCRKRTGSRSYNRKRHFSGRDSHLWDLLLQWRHWILYWPNFKKSLKLIKLMGLINNLMYIIIIIIMSCRQHGYPWPFLATFPYRSSPPAGLLGYILCPHIAAVCKFGLVVLLLLGHMWGSIGVRHLRARPCFSSSVRRVWLVWPV